MRRSLLFYGLASLTGLLFLSGCASTKPKTSAEARSATTVSQPTASPPSAQVSPASALPVAWTNPIADGKPSNASIELTASSREPLLAPNAPPEHVAPQPTGPLAPPPVRAAPQQPRVSHYPIDLPTTLRLADGSNLQVAVAREQIRQAWTRVDASRALWLPSLRAGMNYNRHDGPIQNIAGDVFPVGRGSFFSGLGAGSVAAGSPMIPGIYANFHLADAYFQPLATRQAALARHHAAQATTNDVLLRVSLAYLELQRAAEDLAIALEARGNAQQLFELTGSYAHSGQGLQADADRANAELAIRKNDVLRSQEAVQVASARLAQLLRLDPTVQLEALDDTVIPIDLVPLEVPVGELVAQGLTGRPEMAENRHLVEQAVAQMRRERYAILMPSIIVGTSYGAFGGGINSTIAGTGGRLDADAIAYWQVRNLGVGDRAARAETGSLVRQSNANRLLAMDVVMREVVEAHAQVAARRAQIETARQGVEAALASHQRNLERIRGVQGLPIEVQQSNQALAQARREYLRTIIDYNTAQFTLFRALGWPTRLPCEVYAAPQAS